MLPKRVPDVASSTRASKFLRLLYWLFESFGSLLVFYIVEHSYGLLAAIVAGITQAIIFLSIQIVRERHVSRLTAFSGAMVVLFGALDLYFQSGFFVKLEPAIGNLVFGGFFLWTVLSGKPIIAELAMRERPTLSAVVQTYLRNLTLVWVLFFAARAALYTWMAFSMNLDRALAVRAFLGPLSFGAMFLGEYAYRYLRFGKRAFSKESAPTTSDATGVK
ncbi:MAG: septation protein IspZ [Sandaracinaceae bacterium]|nr:septation protein IspZ [Sandaracinaceae bacterium]